MRSKFCLQSSFGLIVRIFVLPLNTLKTCLHYMLCKYKREKKGSLWGLQFFYWVVGGSNNFIQRIWGWLGVFISHHIYARHGLPRSHVLIFRLRRASFFRFQSASGILRSPEDIIFTMFTVSPGEKFRFLILLEVYRVWFAYLKRATLKKKSVNSILL